MKLYFFSLLEGYDMSTFIRRYAKYLNEKAVSYRQMAFDFCKVKRGWVDVGDCVRVKLHKGVLHEPVWPSGKALGW